MVVGTSLAKGNIMATPHQVIPRKHRPKTFDELIGQPAITRGFLSMIQRHMLPHAILLCGTRGVGKTSTARIFAKALHCESRHTSGNPCGTCSSCKQIETGHHLDVLEIDGASHNGVDAVRELRETAYYLPTHGKHKIYIIDEVHMLSTSAFNALLKILEEPPPHLIFVFATTDPSQLPNTVLSRVIRFDFHPIKTPELAKHLSVIATLETRQISTAALNKIAALGMGSMRDAQMLLEQVFTYFEPSQNIDLPDLSSLFSLISHEVSFTFLQHIGQENTAAALQDLSQLYQEGHDPYLVALELQRLLRYVLLTQEAPKIVQEELAYAPEQIKLLETLGALPAFSQNAVLIMFQSLLRCMQVIRHADYPHWVLEACVIQMSRIRLWTTQTEVKPTQITPPSPTPSKNNDSADTSFSQFLLGKDPLLYGLIQSCRVTIQSDRIEITKSNNAFTFEKLKDKRNLTRLEQLCTGSQFENKKIVFIETATETSPVSPLTPDIQSRRERLTNHPVVKAIQRELNAEVTKIIEDQSIVSSPSQE